MKRTLPQQGTDSITLYMRTYYSLLRSTDVVQIRTLEETHIGMHSSLHPDAARRAPDMSAFTYASLRLPRCIQNVSTIVLAQSDTIFRHHGYDVASDVWQDVSAPARRRRMRYDGAGTLAAFIASISDIDDLVPTLTAFQIEWNKMHGLLSQHQEICEHLMRVEKLAPRDEPLLDEVRAALELTTEDWQRLRNIWRGDFLTLLKRLVRTRKRMAVRLLAGSYIEYRRATQQWWNRVNSEASKRGDLDLSTRPIYFVSSNTHSLVNMLTGFAQQHREELIAYLKHSSAAALHEEWRRIQEGRVRSSEDNFLYYVLKKYLQEAGGRDLLAARRRYETQRGVIRIPSQHTFDLAVHVIELSKLKLDDIDERVRAGLSLDKLAASEAVILNIDYPLGVAAYHLLSRISVNVGELRGAYIIGKAATLNARIGDVMIPNVIYDEHSRNTYLIKNTFSAKDVTPYLIYGDVLDNQRAITVYGTFLQNHTYTEGFLNEGYTDVEMEAGPYLSALYEFIRPRRYPMNELVNLYPMPFDIGILHYASDTPMSKGKNLGSANLSYYGMDPTYASTVAVLRHIFTREMKKLEE